MRYPDGCHCHYLCQVASRMILINVKNISGLTHMITPRHDDCCSMGYLARKVCTEKLQTCCISAASISFSIESSSSGLAFMLPSCAENRISYIYTCRNIKSTHIVT